MEPVGRVEPADVLIVTALLDELDAVLEVGADPDTWREERTQEGLRVHRREIAGTSGMLRVAATWLGAMGEVSAVTKLAQLVATLDPTCVAMCGVCVGRRGEVQLGDIIVADRIYVYNPAGPKVLFDSNIDDAFLSEVKQYRLREPWNIEVAYFAREFARSWAGASERPPSKERQRRWLMRALADHEAEPRFSPRPDRNPDRRVRCPDWLEILDELRRDKLIEEQRGTLKLTAAGRAEVEENRLRDPDGNAFDPPFRVHIGSLATGRLVLEPPNAFERLQRTTRKILGLDTEAASIATIADRSNRRAIIVKSVSDHGDHDKDGSTFGFAARAASAFLLEFLTHHLVPRAAAIPKTDAARRTLETAEVLATKGGLDESLRIYREQLAPALRTARDLAALTDVLRALCRVLHTRGAFDEPLQVCRDDLLPLIDDEPDPQKRTSALILLADAYLACSDVTEAFRILEQDVLPVLQALQQPVLYAAALGHLADVHVACGQLDQALHARKQEVALLEPQDEGSRTATARVELAAVHLARLEVDEARALLEDRVLPALTEPSDDSARARALGVLVDVHLGANALDDALRVARDEQFPFVERIGDIQLIIAARQRLARVLLRRGRPGDREEAAQVLDLALADAERLGLEIRHALRRMRRHMLLAAVHIEDFKNITLLDLLFSHDSDLPGQWTCIAGINGAGKSAVLQAITLTLLGPQRAADIGSGWLDRARRRENGHIHDAALEATVRFGAEARSLSLALRGKGIERPSSEPARDAAMDEVWEEREQHHLLLAYGPGRNLSERLTGFYRNLHVDVQRQMTLFDPLAEVASAEVILEHRDRRGPFLGLLKRLLALVLKDTPLSIAPDRDGLRFRMNGVTVAASDLPDGFRAVVAWLADICAAWCEKAPDEARDGDPTRIRAIVLNDEIDLHLHASLQRVLVPRLRRALPDVQWIVTTHSPLVLSSFDRREIVLLDAQSEGGVRVLDRQIMGWSMDEVYSWLMGTEPRSAALDEHRIRDEDFARVLAQSPTMSEEEVKKNEEFRRKLIERLKGRDGGEGQP